MLYYSYRRTSFCPPAGEGSGEVIEIIKSLPIKQTIDGIVTSYEYDDVSDDETSCTKKIISG